MLSLRKSRLRYWFGLLLMPPSLWALVVTLAPTGWARERVEAALERSMGEPVRLGALRLGLLGGIRLHDLEVGPPAGEGPGPWLRAGRVRVDVNMLQLLAGRLEPTSCRARGVELRVWRRANGSLECGGLFADHAPNAPIRADRPDGPCDTAPVAFELNEARVRVLDEPTGTRLDLTEASASGTWGEEIVQVESLAGLFNGGQMELAAQLDRAGPAPQMELALRLAGVELDAGLGALAYLVPAAVHARRSLDGRLDLLLTLKTAGDSAEAIVLNLLGEGSLRLEDVSLDDSPLLAAVAEGFRVPARGRFGSLKGDFIVAGRRVATRNLKAELGRVPIIMSGWTDFDGRLDYSLRLDDLTARVSGLSERLPAEARSSLADMQAAFSRATLLRIQGSAEQLVLMVDGVRFDEWARRASDPGSTESGRLRDLGRNILNRDRLRR